MHKESHTVKIRTKLAAAVVAALAVGWALTGAACSEDAPSNASNSSKAQVDAKADARAPYLPKNDVEFNNYNKAQELYDDPSSILWCSTAFPTASSPIITVPIAGKLTSSSVSYYPGSSPQEVGSWSDGAAYLNVENRSIDGMYHGNPPGYRYGFTPGGQYVDLFNTSTICTTALTKFQRENTDVTIKLDDGGASDIQKQAEAALKAGDRAKAEQLLEQVAK
jgi:hypothetical protein